MVGIVLFIIFIHKFIYLTMKKQLINEAKRLQELAGIRPLNENTSPSGGEVWVFGTPGNPNEEVKVFNGNKLIETITKGEL